jgi:hypothetical protein
MSQSFELRIIEDGTTRSDHSAVIQLAIDTCDSHARYLLTQTDLANIRRDCNRILKELSERRMAK